MNSNEEIRESRGGRSEVISRTYKKIAENVGKERDRRAAEFVENNPEDVALLKEELAKIDFGLLREIFVRHAHKSGVADDVINWPDPASITIIPNQGAFEKIGAGYDALVNRIYITPEPFEEQMKSVLQRDLNFRRAFLTARLLFVVVHEYVHAVGYNLTTEHREKGPHGLTREIQSAGGFGVEVTEYDKKYKPLTATSIFRVLNEGVVTRIGDQIVEEYVRRGGTPDLKRIAIVSQAEFKHAPALYVFGSELVEDITEKIAFSTNTPKDVIWNGMMASYFAGDVLLFPENGNLLEETLGPDLFAELMQLELEDESALKRMQEKIRVGLPTMRYEIGERWLRKLYPEVEPILDANEA